MKMRVVLKSRRDVPPLVNHRKASTLVSMSMGLDYNNLTWLDGLPSLPPKFTSIDTTITLTYDSGKGEDYGR